MSKILLLLSSSLVSLWTYASAKILYSPFPQAQSIYSTSHFNDNLDLILNEKGSFQFQIIYVNTSPSRKRIMTSAWAARSDFLTRRRVERCGQEEELGSENPTNRISARWSRSAATVTACTFVTCSHTPIPSVQSWEKYPRGVQPSGMSGPHWTKSCLGPHVKYTVTRNHKKISSCFKWIYNFVLGQIHKPSWATCSPWATGWMPLLRQVPAEEEPTKYLTSTSQNFQGHFWRKVLRTVTARRSLGEMMSKRMGLRRWDPGAKIEHQANTKETWTLYRLPSVVLCQYVSWIATNVSHWWGNWVWELYLHNFL